MREVYGDHLNGIQRLMKAIRKRRRLQDEEERGREEQGEQNGLNNLQVVPRISSWKEAVQQWEKGHPERGLMPIRDWPLAWRKMTPRTSALYQTRMSRKLIAEEFHFCGRDENRMRKIHGSNMDCIASLCMSIRRNCKIRKGNLQSRLKETDAEDVERDDDGHEEEEEADEEESLTRKRKGTEDDILMLTKRSRPSRIQPLRVKKSCS